MLWKFYKDNPEDCSYLLGTMHLATDEAYTYADIAKKYIDAVPVYAGEMDLNEAAAHDMMQHMLLPDDDRFSSFFRPKQYQKYLKIIVKTFGIDITKYDRCTPFFLNNLLAELSLPKSKNEALDHYLWNYAMANDKEMKGVESFEDQLRVLQQIPQEFQVKSFRSALKNIKAFKSKLRSINKMYREGEVNKIYKASKKSMGPIRKLMIYDRNIYMTEKVIKFVGQKPLFVAVGAAHLPGKKGLLALLKKEGFTIKPFGN
jgi:uncharacterized protein